MFSIQIAAYEGCIWDVSIGIQLCPFHLVPCIDLDIYSGRTCQLLHNTIHYRANYITASLQWRKTALTSAWNPGIDFKALEMDMQLRDRCEM